MLPEQQQDDGLGKGVTIWDINYLKLFSYEALRRVLQHVTQETWHNPVKSVEA